ncbi:MAG: HAMP domain-containing histidine kinase, partial [Bdellovibrionales bacterium]|nr:HAMP domain-containing histidine kinase [Bdellovibrionales bacterium]
GAGTQENIQALNTSLDRINRLFDDVVLMNKPFEKVSSKELSAEKLRVLLDELIEEFNQAILVEFSAGEVLVDVKRLRVILRNLIKNATRYGKVAKISVSKTQSEVFIDVQDEGGGVSEADSQKIFEEFFRSEEAKSKNADGLGLGLYITNKMAKEMGASVKLTNPGQPKANFRLILRRPH